MRNNDIYLLTTAILLTKIETKQKFNYEDYEAVELVLKKFLKNLLDDDYVKFKKELIKNECEKHK